MTRVEEFNGFYAATSRQCLQLTYALCGDRRVARRATVDAYRRAWRDWLKIVDREPLSYVRNEAWKLTTLSNRTHLLRRKHERDSDTKLLEALGNLPADNRRLLALMTLGDIDLEAASLEVGIPAEEGIENVTTALGMLESDLGQSIDEIERRLHALGTITTSIVLPPAVKIRKLAKRGRQRNTFGLVAAALAAMVASGFVVADGNAMQRSTELPQRQKIGAENQDVLLKGKKVDASQLLTVEQVQRLDPEEKWKIVNTDDDPKNPTPYATCPTKRFANPNPERVFVRTYESSSADSERTAQSIEVAPNAKSAAEAYGRLLSWYSNCAHPRVQLVDAWTVQRPIGDFQILRLRSHRSPERTFTVGFSHSGTVTSTVVHEVDGAKGPDIDLFAQTLNDSVSRVCVASGGNCTSDIKVQDADPPATSTDPGFLGIVDLPPIAKVDKVWAGTEATKFKENPARTPCDLATFQGKDVAGATSKTFVIPEAADVPTQFGLVETMGRFKTEKAAKKFASTVSDRVEACPDANLSASLDQRKSFKSGDVEGESWRIALEVNKSDKVYYRMGLIRRGADVAQVRLTSAKNFEISKGAFTALTQRAGQRMKYLD